MKTSKSDQSYIMNTAILECSIQENVEISELRLIQGKSGTWYIISRKKDDNGKPKIYFKKKF